MKQKFTYEHWWSGEVILEYANIYYNSNTVQSPVLVKWEHFSDTEVDKIKEKQIQLFENSVRDLLRKFQVVFLERYEKSKMKLQFLNDEKNQCIDIMFAPIPNNELILLHQWDFAFPYLHLLEIQTYIKDTIKKGMSYNYENIHSPNSLYQDKSKIQTEIYAQTLWEYFNWLESSFENQENKGKFRDENDNYIKKTKYLWFKIGLLFANGEMENLIAISKTKYQGVPNYSEIARQLGNYSFRPYIIETINGNKNNDKNIFSNIIKCEFIEEHCKKNNIAIVESFKKRKF